MTSITFNPMGDVNYAQRHRLRLNRQDLQFLDKISDLLLYSDVPPSRVNEMIADDDIYLLFCAAFTHKDVHKEENVEIYGPVVFPLKRKIMYGDDYEALETVGDPTLNKTIIWYFQQAYPALRTPGIMSKFKGNMGENLQVGRHFTSHFNLWGLMIAPPEIMSNYGKVVGDLFEALLGAMEVAVEYKFGPTSHEGGVYGVGYATCASMIMKRYGEMKDSEFPLKRSELNVGRTIFKEMIDQLNKIYTRELFPDESVKGVKHEPFKFEYESVKHEGDQNKVKGTMTFPRDYPPIVISAIGKSVSIAQEKIAESFMRDLRCKYNTRVEDVDYTQGKTNPEYNLGILSKISSGLPLLSEPMDIRIDTKNNSRKDSKSSTISTPKSNVLKGRHISESSRSSNRSISESSNSGSDRSSPINYGKGYSGKGYDGKGYSGKGYDGKGYDGKGYDGKGYSGKGYDGKGYDGKGYDGKGYSGKGYDGKGYDGKGYSGKGYSGKGYDGKGYDGKGYSGKGYDGKGYSGKGYDGKGYSGKGYDGKGYSGKGYSGKGYSGKGYSGK
jgi:dsRNA-specific ribonuclease